jgi:hypothetical protein
MNFADVHIFNEDRFSIGVEEQTGKYYLSIPVSNQYADYEEYYEIEPSQFQACPSNLEELRQVAAKCRARQNDAHLLVQPGRLRGEPV